MNKSDKPIWPEVSDDGAQESQILTDVAQFIANSTDLESVSMIADTAIKSAGRIEMLEDGDGRFCLALDLPFNRSWASVERALEKSLFEITDRNRSEGVYFTVYLGPSNEDEGWFDWLWGGEAKNPLVGRHFIVTVSPESDQQVKVVIKTLEEDQVFQVKQEQGLLAILKGNIS